MHALGSCKAGGVRFLPEKSKEIAMVAIDLLRQGKSIDIAKQTIVLWSACKHPAGDCDVSSQM